MGECARVSEKQYAGTSFWNDAKNRLLSGSEHLVEQSVWARCRWGTQGGGFAWNSIAVRAMHPKSVGILASDLPRPRQPRPAFSLARSWPEEPRRMARTKLCMRRTRPRHVTCAGIPSLRTPCIHEPCPSPVPPHAPVRYHPSSPPSARRSPRQAERPPRTPHAAMAARGAAMAACSRSPAAHRSLQLKSHRDQANSEGVGREECVEGQSQ